MLPAHSWCSFLWLRDLCQDLCSLILTNVRGELMSCIQGTTGWGDGPTGHWNQDQVVLSHLLQYLTFTQAWSTHHFVLTHWELQRSGPHSKQIHKSQKGLVKWWIQPWIVGLNCRTYKQSCQVFLAPWCHFLFPPHLWIGFKTACYTGPGIMKPFFLSDDSDF